MKLWLWVGAGMLSVLAPYYGTLFLKDLHESIRHKVKQPTRVLLRIYAETGFLAIVSNGVAECDSSLKPWPENPKPGEIEVGQIYYWCADMSKCREELQQNCMQKDGEK